MPYPPQHRSSLDRTLLLFIASVGAEAALLIALIDLLGIFPSTPGFGLMQSTGVATGFLFFIGAMFFYARCPRSERRFARPVTWRTLSPLIALILLAAFLRFLHLGKDSLWVDELASWLRATQPTVSEALMNGHVDSMWPGYHIPLFFSTRLFGDSEFALRFPSVLFGVMHIPLIYQIGRRLYSRREGLIAALLMTVLLNPIAYSQEARSYSMLLFFTLLSTYLWFDWLQKLHRTGKTPAGTPLRYFTTAAMLPYLQWFGLLVIAVHGLGIVIFILSRKRGVVALTITYLVILLTALPLFTTLGGTVEIDNNWIPHTKGVIAALIQYIGWAFNESPIWAYVVIATWSMAAATQLRWKQRGNRPPGSLFFSPTGLLILWLAVPLTAVYLFSIFVKPAWITRYLMISLPAVYLLLARAITRLPIGANLRQALAAGFAAASLLYVFIVYGYYSAPQKAQFREAVNYVLNRDGEYQESVIVTHTGGPPEYMQYYFTRAGGARQPDFDGGSRHAIAVVEEAVASGQGRYVWYITAHYRPQPAFISYLDESFRPIDSVEFWHATVRLYEVRENDALQ